MATEKKFSGPGTGALEGFEELVKQSKGKDCVMVIQQVLKHPQIYVFGELLDAPNIKALEKTENEQWLNLLRVFAYGTYKDYKAKEKTLPKIGAKESEKLKKLTIVTLAAQRKLLPYPYLLAELELQSLRELEDLIIDSVYQGLIKGKLDQNKQAFEVQFAIGRDIGPRDVDDMMGKLQAWLNSSEMLLKNLEDQIAFAKKTQEARKEEEDDLSKQKASVVTAIKAQQQEDIAQLQGAAKAGRMGMGMGMGMGLGFGGPQGRRG